jgi:hypothetical protein
MKWRLGQEEFQALDNGLREHYEAEGDGGFVLVVIDDDGSRDGPPPDVSGLKSALAKQKEEARSAREELQAVRADKAAGGDRAQFELLQRRHQASEERLKAIDAEGAAALQAAKLDWDGKLVEPTAKLEKAEGELHELLIDGEIHRAITAAHGVPKLLAHHLRKRVKMELDADGARRIVVTDDNGNVRLDPRGEPVPIDQAVEELKLFGDPALLRAFDRDRNGNGH